MLFLTPILTWLGSFLGGPFIKAALAAYTAKLNSEQSVTLAKEQIAAQELALQVREAELSTQYRLATIGRWYEPDHLMGYTVAIYFGKLLVIDKVLGWGSTDPLAGWAAITAGMVVTYYFGKRGFENIVRIWSFK